MVSRAARGACYGVDRRALGVSLLFVAAVGSAASLATVRAELLEASVSADGYGVDLVVRNASPVWTWTFRADVRIPGRPIAFLSEPVRLGPGEVGKILVSATGPLGPCETFRIQVQPKGLPWGQALKERKLADDCPA